MRPLANITVLDLTVNVPGPFCSMILGDLGARVIKVEPPSGDALRHSSDMWNYLNRGKESIVLDLKKDCAKEILSRLAKDADIVLEGWRPGVAKRLGADYGTLSAKNNSLVYCSISGFGQDGPWRDRPGHDLNYLALSGYLDLQASIEGSPWPPSVLLSDKASGLYAAIMVLAGVNGRKLSGRGTYIDLSMTESVVSLLGLELSKTFSENETHPNVTGIPHYGLFKCADDKWISLGIVNEDHFWKSFCKTAGLNDLCELNFRERVERREHIQEILNEKFQSLTADKWEQLLQQADVPVAKIVSLKDLYSSPQLKARDVFINTKKHKFLAQPAHFSSTSIAPNKELPDLGEHTENILEKLGYLSDDIKKLKDEGSFGKPER